MYANALIGCINEIGNGYKATKIRFFYISFESNLIKDVTKELFELYSLFNRSTKAIRKLTKADIYMPYQYEEGLLVLGYGTEFLTEEILKDLALIGNEILTFPLKLCRVNMYPPSSVRDILGCEDVFDLKIEDALMRERCL
ncbi:TPA: hypothetical protein ACTZ3A_001397 [Bacillus cereus]